VTVQQTLLVAPIEPPESRALDDDARTRLAELYAHLAQRLPQIAARIVTLTHASSPIDSLEAERFRELLVDWMRSGLSGPYDASFRVIRARIGRRFLDSALLQGAVYVTLLAIRTEYRRAIGRYCSSEKAWHVLDSVDTLIDLELDIMLGYYRDHHDRRTRCRERDAIHERLTALRTLTAGLAHEVRNPLNSAKLQLEVLERRLRREYVDARLCEPSERARTEIEKLSDLLDELLEFASPPELDLVRYDLMGIVRDVIEAQRPAADRQHITLALCGPDRAAADLDVSKMRTILHHLLVNGIEAVGRGGAIRMIVRAHVDRIQVEVIDDGPGISSEVRARIYEPFYSTKPAGTGLGLSIVHSMVTLHGGTIDIQSEPGSTAVAISIPRRLIGPAKS